MELAAVVAIVALLATAAVTRFGWSTLENSGADGFARRLALDLVQARRRTVATGENHYVLVTNAAGKMVSYVLMRRAAGGDVAVDQIRTAPTGVTAISSHTTLEFDFDGASLAAYSISVAGPNRSWTVSTVMATGSVQTTP